MDALGKRTGDGIMRAHDRSEFTSYPQENSSPPGRSRAGLMQSEFMTHMEQALVSPTAIYDYTAGRITELYNFGFWKVYIEKGGHALSQYMTQSVPNGNGTICKFLLSPELTNWCIRMREHFFPKCKHCRKPVPPALVRHGNLENRGSVYYACECCSRCCF